MDQETVSVVGTALSPEAVARLEAVAQREAQREMRVEQEGKFDNLIGSIKKDEMIVKANLGGYIDEVLTDMPELKNQGEDGARTAVKIAEQYSRRAVKETPAQEVVGEKMDASAPANTSGQGTNVNESKFAKAGDPTGLVRKENGTIDFASSDIDAFSDDLKSMALSRGCKQKY